MRGCSCENRAYYFFKNLTIRLPTFLPDALDLEVNQLPPNHVLENKGHIPYREKFGTVINTGCNFRRS